jgi:hypothetical protein
MTIYSSNEKFTINIGNKEQAYINQVRFWNVTKIESDGQLAVRLYSGDNVVATVTTDSTGVYVDELKLNDLKLYSIWCGDIVQNFHKGRQ